MKAIQWVCAALWGGCSLGPLPGIAEKKDSAVAIAGGNAWVAATAEEALLLVLGEAEPGRKPPYALSRLTRVGAMSVEQGTWLLDDTSATLTFRATQVSRFARGSRPDAPGAATEKLELEKTYGVARGAQRVVLEGTPLLPAFTPLAVALQGPAPQTPECIFQWVSLLMLNVEARMPGFGGVGMIRYTNPVKFKGLSGGTAEVRLADLFAPRSEVEFNAFSDLAGVTLQGTSGSQTDTVGTGYLFGTVRWAIALAGGNFSAEVDFGDAAGSDAVRIVEGVASSGQYRVVDAAGQVHLLPHTAQHVNALEGCFAVGVEP